MKKSVNTSVSGCAHEQSQEEGGYRIIDGTLR